MKALARWKYCLISCCTVSLQGTLMYLKLSGKELAQDAVQLTMHRTPTQLIADSSALNVSALIIKHGSSLVAS
eukprot:2928-Heterococcus_DN1.PRE.1